MSKFNVRFVFFLIAINSNLLLAQLPKELLQSLKAFCSTSHDYRSAFFACPCMIVDFKDMTEYVIKHARANEFNDIEIKSLYWGFRLVHIFSSYFQVQVTEGPVGEIYSFDSQLYLNNNLLFYQIDLTSRSDSWIFNVQNKEAVNLLAIVKHFYPEV
ncbi:MAG: hypothetical protein O2897_05110 [bacterium]|nr:hypothetical protein [bacterium]